MTDNHNKCPICHKSRGPHDLSHGKCMEEAARRATERTTQKKIKGKDCKFSDEQLRKGRFNAASHKFRDGDLPDWMYS